jgi:hypothetical protein
MARAPVVDFKDYQHPSKAQSWLEKSGWTQGSGIGANQQGITSALKTKQRTDNGGLGRADDVDETNAWWLDGFLLAARKLQRNKADGNHDEKKPGQLVDPLCPLYSRFVRASSTTTTATSTESGATTTTTTTTTSTTIIDISKETFDACDGKAARYIMPDAKLARVAAQDQLFKEKRKLDDFKDDHKEQRKAEKKAAKLAAKLAAKKEAKRNAKKKARLAAE